MKKIEDQSNTEKQISNLENDNEIFVSCEQVSS